MPALNDEQFFHGTTTDITHKTLHPSAKTGKENYDYDGGFNDGGERKTHVFFSKHHGYWSGESPDKAEATAWTWGSMGQHNHKEEDITDRYVPKRTHVYEVEPIGKHRADMAAADAYMAKSAKIKRRIDIPPEAAMGRGVDPKSKNWTPVPGGVQGTFGGVNWDRYHDKTAQAAGEQKDRDTAGLAAFERHQMGQENPNQRALFTDRRMKLGVNEFDQSTVIKKPGRTWKHEAW